MYKFKVSKYKNVVASIPKRNEGWLLDDINVNNFAIHSNLLKSSASFIAYFSGGGNIGIANVNDLQQKPAIIRSHGSDLSDIDFSPFDDGILASASVSGQLKLWQLTQLSPTIAIPLNALQTYENPEPIVVIQFHKTVETVISLTTKRQIKLFDITKSQPIIESMKCSQIQSIDCKYDGRLYALTDAQSTGTTEVKVWDPRIDGAKAFALEFPAHDIDRDSRVLWLGDKPYVISCGFSKRKAREAYLWDTRSHLKPIASMNEFEPSTGVWIPVFDSDTQMLFIAGRNDSAINHWEASDLIAGTAQLDNNGVNKKSIDMQIKGVSIVAKRALNIMDTEVNRIVLLGADGIAPVSYKVPRKTYREFHSDLFPETKAPDSNTSLDDWLDLNDSRIPTISLNPGVNKREELLRLNKTLGAEIRVEASDEEVDQFLSICKEDGIDVDASLKNLIESSKPIECFSDNKQNNNCPHVEPMPTAPKPQPQRRGFTIRTTKFRHLKGTIAGREAQITNFNGLSKTIPGECDGFKANSKFCAVPIGPTCNQLAVLGVTKCRRLAGGVIPHLVCGHTIGDFAFDPFDEHRIAIGCDDGTVQLWTIPEQGLTRNLDAFEFKLSAHNDRLTVLQFHPNASHVLATFAMDLELIIWDIEAQEPKITIKAHSEPLFSMCWSPNGALLATLCKDQKLRVFDPRDGQRVVEEGLGCQGSRGGRVCWAQNGNLVIVTGFSRASERQFLVFDKNDFSKPIASEGLDVSPAILIPFYDEDSSTLFLTGKGDSVVYTFEISSPTDNGPYIHPLSHYNTSTPHQSIAYIHKRFCDVRSVEFARGYRLTTASIEPISFTVPRLRIEYFQDDLFPETKVLWAPSLTSGQWFDGENGETKYISLKPEDMSVLSEAQPPAPTKKASNSVQIQFEGDFPLQSSLAFLSGGRRKQEMITQQMSEKVQFKDEELPQEHWEGVDPNEWDE